MLIEEYMNQGDLLGVLKDSRPNMPLETQLTFALQVADGMDYLACTLWALNFRLEQNGSFLKRFFTDF